MIVQTILMGMELNYTKDKLMGKIVVNTSAVKYHVAEIQRCIHTVKERFRSVENDLPLFFYKS